MRVVRIITGMSLLTLFFVMGCRDVFEKDISEKEVVLVAPADSVETTRATCVGGAGWCNGLSLGGCVAFF